MTSRKVDLTLPNSAGPLSPYMIGMLRYFDGHRIPITALGTYHASTLGALCGRGYLSTKSGYVELTEDGHAALRVYDRSAARTRTAPSDLTERCLRLLRLSRSMVAAQKLDTKPPGPIPVARRAKVA